MAKIEKTKEELREMMKVAQKLRDEAKPADRYACNTLISSIQYWDKQSEDVQEKVLECVEYKDCTAGDIRGLRGR